MTERSSVYSKCTLFWVKVVRRLFCSPENEQIMKFLVRLGPGNALWILYCIFASACVLPFALLVVGYGRVVVTVRRFRKKNTGRQRVLFISHESSLTGAPICLADLIITLDKEKYEPFVVSRVEGPLTEMLDEFRIPCFVLPNSVFLSQEFEAVMGFYNLIIFCWSIPFVTLLLLDKRIDLVHTNVIITPDFAFSAWCIGVRNVWHLRDTLKGGIWQKIQVALLTRLAHRIICISHFAASVLGEKGRGGQIKVIHDALRMDYCVDPSKGCDFRREFDIPQHIPVVGVVGQITPDKGQEYFVRAACIVHKQVPEAKFFLVGSMVNDKYVEYLRSIARSQGLAGEHLVFTGIRDDIPKVIHGFDIVVVPSVWQEMFGRVNIEAMCCEKPVVATTRGGIPEIVLHEKTGLLVPPGDANALSEAIIRLIDNPEERRRFGEEGRKRVTENFSMEIHTSKIERCYAELLGRGDA